MTERGQSGEVKRQELLRETKERKLEKVVIAHELKEEKIKANATFIQKQTHSKQSLKHQFGV